MTLQDIFDKIGENPMGIFIFFVTIPVITFLLTWITKGESDKSPWNYLYSGIIYISCIPGIFSIMLCLYNFLFVRKNMLEVNVLAYFLPIISMITTLIILNRETSLNSIPGFDKLSGLLMTLSTIIAIMFLLDRTHIIAFIHIPVQYLVGLIIALLIIFRIGAKKIFAK